MVGQPPLLAAVLRQGEASTAQFARDRDGQITGVLEFGEVLAEEAVVPVIAGSSLGAAAQHIVGQNVIERLVHQSLLQFVR
jgi:hypothetical protein